MPTVAERRAEINASAASQRKALTAFSNRFPELFAWSDNICETENMHSYVSHLYGGTFDIRISNLDSFKEDKLLEMLEWVESTFRVEVEGKDNPIGRSKEFSARVPWDGRHLDIYVHANLAMDSKGCTRVIVNMRTETVEVPEYRLECHESN